MIAAVVCSAPFVRDFVRALESRGFDGWTMIPKVLGKGGRSDPQMDDDVWPGYSALLLVFFPPERADEMRDLLREYDRKVAPFKAFLFRGVEEI
ncbi:MAG: hypothetical protein GXO29_04065 [Thermotogae bacterium]|nr:hypothetical protein [Thermotogota bacterium]